MYPRFRPSTERSSSSGQSELRSRVVDVLAPGKKVGRLREPFSLNPLRGAGVFDGDRLRRGRLDQILSEARLCSGLSILLLAEATQRNQRDLSVLRILLQLGGDEEAVLAGKTQIHDDDVWSLPPDLRLCLDRVRRFDHIVAESAKRLDCRDPIVGVEFNNRCERNSATIASAAGHGSYFTTAFSQQSSCADSTTAASVRAVSTESATVGFSRGGAPRRSYDCEHEQCWTAAYLRGRRSRS
jgi:hypothetical protein